MTEQDEIRKLRELIAKQQLQLKNQEELLAQKDEVIRKQNIRIENMTQALLHAKKKIFGRSSEMTATMKGQMFLFEPTAELAKKLLQEQKAVTIPAHKWKIVPRWILWCGNTANPAGRKPPVRTNGNRLCEFTRVR